MPFEIEPAAQGFPFSSKVFASAATEQLAANEDELLVWMDPDSIIFQEPEVLLMARERLLGCRPVDHVLIGSPYDQPADAFWRTVYQTCGVSQECLFTLTTSADEVRIRPYLNAGLLVVRPEAGLLRAWCGRFHEVLQAGIFEPFFDQDILYRIFLHQAILAGITLAALAKQQIEILPHLVNYPLHMHQAYPPARRPARMNDLISGRYDTFFEDPEWPCLFPSEEPLSGWLSRQLTTYELAAVNGT